MVWEQVDRGQIPLQSLPENGIAAAVLLFLALIVGRPQHLTPSSCSQGIAKAEPGQPGCECTHAVDVYVQFPNGLKRPDISIFCREPSDEEQDSALTMIPEAVIEVVSKGYEAKDLEIGPPFYLSQGVKDVVVFDPLTLLVLHVRKHQTTRQISPVVIDLECGCRVSV